MIKKAAKKTSIRPAKKGGISIKKYFKLCATSRGQTLVVATVFIAALLILSLSIVNRGTNVSQENRLVNQKISARTLAEAGIEKAIFCLNQSIGTNCGGTFGANYVGENDVPLNDGVFTTTITTINGNTKAITATGYIPSSSNPKNTVTIKTEATINSDVITFNYGVQNGIGGISMTNDTKIIGNVFSGGDIEGANDAEITGDATVAGAMALTADQSNTTQNANFGFGTSSPRLDIAQSFVVSTDNQLKKISFYIKKVSTPSNVTVRILTDNGGVPSKTVLASGTLNASQVTTNYGWVDVLLSSPPPIFAGLTYWVSIDTTASTSKYWIIGQDSQNGYPSGKAMYSASWNATSPVWSDAGGDFNFKAWLGGTNENTEIEYMTIGGDAYAHHIEGTHVGRDAYAETIHMDSYVGRDAHAGTIDDSTVVRDAYADHITNTTVGGHKYSGQAQPDAAPVGMPISDGQIQEFKDAAIAGGTSGAVSLSGHDEISLGPQKITGSVSLANWAKIHITGPIWITGNLSLSNFSQMTIDPSFGAQGTVIVVEGTISIANTDTVIGGNGTAGCYLLAISLSSGTAANMSNGSPLQTQSLILYAPYGQINLSNFVALREVTAYKLVLSNFATVSYESGVAHATFSTGPGGSWILKKGTWQEL